ncbi:putative ubiquitin-conjugating enzyme E2 38 [Dioscorea cayenensis subsp. rotundata]|uniref:E2 ubiquitin-conjugating enzyme n=1 Tax=Dioscorea cayennensis subsp. rotundata TaxID=55577 RepID=A0AB40B472_DIOCR|nr:putative ubiquitin-conjugating enzyme E2 38 [Dioscorea cayenensis subsp. rotundata]
MEPKPIVFNPLMAKPLFPFSDDVVPMEASSSSLPPSFTAIVQSTRRSTQDSSPDVIDIDMDDAVMETPVTVKSLSDYKNKQIVGYDSNWQNLVKDALAEDVIDSVAYNGPKEDDMLGFLNGSDPDSSNSNYYNEDEDEDEGEEEDEDDEFGYDEDDHVGHATNQDYNYSLAATFDGLGLPTGVEATLSWLQDSSVKMRSMQEKIQDEIDRRFKAFKQFDTVQDHSDHYFFRGKGGVALPEIKKPPKEWVTRIQNEWKLLEKDLPETIYVRVYEERMDLLRAVMVGPSGTPYHDGLFFFDICFPPNYPHSPPQAHYHSGGLRINPNLYSNGKVCLSLLNTWPGTGCENWNPKKSTMLQVLVSIQALILNAKPYFNEPGYEQYANTRHGEERSKHYNEETFLHSCKTMLYSLRRPPKHFEDLVAGHFRERGKTILTACTAYMRGVEVASPITDDDDDNGVIPKVMIDDGRRSSFKPSLMKLFEDLLMEFTVKGAECTKFLDQKAKAGASNAKDAAALL